MFLKKSHSHDSFITAKTIFNIIILLVLFWICSRPLKGIGENIYGFIGKTFNNLAQSLYSSKSDINELLNSRTIAQARLHEITKLKIAQSDLENKADENIKLRNLLNLKHEINSRTIAAEVIGRSSDNWHKQVILNKGLADSIKTGDTVLSDKGIVGQIVEATKTSSTVQLISDPSYKIGCKIEGKDIIGILSGKTNSFGLLQFIPVGSKIKVGDKILTSGISASGLMPTYPKGYPIGKVSKVSKKKNKFSDLYIEVMLYENLSSSDNVLIFSTG